MTCVLECHMRLCVLNPGDRKSLNSGKVKMTQWPSNGAPVEMSQEEKIATRDAEIKTWLIERAALKLHKDKEMVCRKNVTEMLFPNPTKGTQRFALGNGYNVKLVHKLNYKLGNPELIDPETQAKVPTATQVFALCDAVDEMGDVAKVLIDRLIKWTPELSVTEYDKLDLSDPIQRKIKDMIDAMLTIEPGAPTLDFEEPKS
jgi:hypothetical protein